MLLHWKTVIWKMRHIENHQFSVPLLWYCSKGKAWILKIICKCTGHIKGFSHAGHWVLWDFISCLHLLWTLTSPLCTQCDFFNYFFKITFTYRVQRGTLGFFFFGSANYLSRTKQKHNSSCAALFRNDTWKGLFLLQAPQTAGFSVGYYTWRWCELNSSADRTK